MATATHGAIRLETGAMMMTMNQPQRLKPEELAELVKQVQALRAVTKMTGVFTSRRIGSLLEGLCTEDMVEVGKALQLKPRELPRKAEVSVKRFDAQGKPEANFNR
jgi:hypothetical protein